MKYTKEKALEILKRTPKILNVFLEGLSDEWIYATEGPGTWNPKQIVSHLILGEKTDWIPRTKLILSSAQEKHFEPFNMTTHLNYCKEKSMTELLQEFEKLRIQNLEYFQKCDLNKLNLDKKGVHNAFGTVTLRQHLSTWVTHDLGHIAQIARVMAKQYKSEVGPWMAYLSILNR